MEELKVQFITSFVSGIGKTTGGLIVIGTIAKLWSLYTNENSKTMCSKKTYDTKSTQTKCSYTELEEKDELYKKIFDNLIEV